MLALLLPLAAANPIHEFFPPEPISDARAQQLLSEAELGPPATEFRLTYSKSDLGERLTALEDHAFGRKRAPVSDQLRTYAKHYLRLSQEGSVLRSHSAYLAEHLGIVHEPRIFGLFVFGAKDREAPMVKKLVDQMGDATAGRSYGLAIDCVDIQCVGVGYYLDPLVNLDGISRTVTGESLELRGQQEGDTGSLTFFITTDRADVASLDAVKSKKFNVDLPLPGSNNAYSVAIQRQAANMFASEAVFQVYREGHLPRGWEPDRVAGTANLNDPQAALAIINRERAALGYEPLELTESTAWRSELGKLPDDFSSLLSTMTAITSTDPLPDTPHGLIWPGAMFHRSLEQASIDMLSHPVIRFGLMRPNGSHLVYEHAEWHSARVALFATVPATFDADAAREEVRATIRAGWWTKKEVPDAIEGLESRLDVIARRVLDGELSEAQGQERLSSFFNRLLETSDANGGAYWIVPVGPGVIIGPDSLKVIKGAKTLSIGSAGNAENKVFVVIVTS